jgi:hypothetical protein
MAFPPYLTQRDAELGGAQVVGALKTSIGPWNCAAARCSAAAASLIIFLIKPGEAFGIATDVSITAREFPRARVARRRPRHRHPK